MVKLFEVSSSALKFLKHLPVVEYITPEQFDYYGDIARRKGFLYVASGPLVRSSYHAADFHPVVRR